MVSKLLAPRHHPPVEFLIDYASGGASQAESLMIDAHLAFCPGCRRGAMECDAIGGALLNEIAPARLPPNLLNRTLAGIDAAEGGGIDPHAPIELPALLHRQLGADLDAGPWRKLPGGLCARSLPLACRSGRLVLLKVPSGRSVFRHKHVGDEWTLVLQGGFSDDSGHYGKGDFACRAETDEHRPVAEQGEDCICMVLMRDDLRFTGLLGRLAGPLIRL